MFAMVPLMLPFMRRIRLERPAAASSTATERSSAPVEEGAL
jgi:hypothetical protein